MKMLIHSFTVFSCYIALGVVLSCADETSADSRKASKTGVGTAASLRLTKHESLNDKGVPVLVQQFHGCKAHR